MSIFRGDGGSVASPGTIALSEVLAVKTAAEAAQGLAESAATAASSSASAAASSASAASTSATDASTAQTAAETALDSFDDRYLGAKASDPTLDNDGDALIDGALYFNTTSNSMKVYDLGNTQWKNLLHETALNGSVPITTGTEAQRDGSPAAGYFRFNTDLGKFEGYDGTSWGQVGGGSGGNPTQSIHFSRVFR